MVCNTLLVWIILVFFRNTSCSEMSLFSDLITVHVQPQYIERNESIVVFSCNVPTKGHGPGFSINWQDYSSVPCFSDCYFDDNACPHITLLLIGCWCDELLDDGTDYCPNGTTSVTFKLRNVEYPRDIIGTWRCIYAAESLQEAATVKMFVRSANPRLKGSSSVIERHNETFTCSSKGGQPPAEFQWYRDDGTQRHNLTDLAVSGDGQSQLTYTADRAHEGHHIVCVVQQLDKPSREVNESLLIMYPAVVQIGPCVPEHIAQKKSAVELTCEVIAQGNPEVTNIFKWDRNDTILQDKTSSTLMVSDQIQHRDEGTYSCTGVNGAESQADASQLWIIVNYHPENVTIDAGSNVVIREGETLILTCTTAAVPNDISYTWTPSGKTGATLTIPNVQPKDAGDYICHAENTFQVCGDDQPKTDGADSEATNVTVLYTISKPEEPVNFHAKDNVTSSSITVAWQEGHSGNSPPVIYTLETKVSPEGDCSDSSGYERYTQIEGSKDGTQATPHQVLIESLLELTSYCVRIWAENQRTTGLNTSDEVCIFVSQTKASPNVDDLQINSIATDNLILTWKYTAEAEQDQTYTVGLTFLYSADNEEPTVYPETGRVDANLQVAMILGEFNTDKTYYVSAAVYEGNNEIPTKGLTADPKHPEKLGPGAIVGITLVTILMIGLVATLVVFVALGVVDVNVDFTKLKGRRNRYEQDDQTERNNHVEETAPYEATNRACAETSESSYEQLRLSQYEPVDHKPYENLPERHPSSRDAPYLHIT